MLTIVVLLGWWLCQRCAIAWIGALRTAVGEALVHVSCVCQSSMPLTVLPLPHLVL
jgi:hypothetical protein